MPIPPNGLRGIMHDYQVQVEDFALTHPYCGLFLDMGLGKTMITLDTIYQRNPNSHILVVAPKNIARSTWREEIEKWDLPLRYKSLIVNEKDKDLPLKKKLELYQSVVTDPPTIYFINRENLKSLYDNLPVIGGKRRWYFPNVVLDESQSFKSHKSGRFKIMKSVRPCCTSVIELTGTPSPNGLMDLWSQIYLLDQGQRLGTTITSYRRTFFDECQWANGYAVKWKPKPGAEDEIYRRISDIVISVKNANLNVPPVTYNDVSVHLDPSDIKLYRDFLKTQVLSLPGVDDIEAANRAVLHGKLSQMASGAIYVDDQHNYQVIHTKKLDMMESIMNASSGNIMVAYKYHSDKMEILKRFPIAQVFDGSTAMKDSWNRREIPLMLIHPASAGFGLNLQYGGHTLIWYTIPDNLEHYLQTNARLPREGQTDPVIIHHLITRGTVDEGTRKSLTLKDESEEALLTAVKLALDPTFG